MHKRSIAIAAAAALLALATGCSSTAPARPATATPSSSASQPAPGALSSPSQETVQVGYLAVLRGAATLDPSLSAQYKDFAVQRSSDARLVAAGRETCTDLQSHKPTEVLTLLQRDGWTRFEAIDFIQVATRPQLFCPSQWPTVQAWVTANGG